MKIEDIEMRIKDDLRKIGVDIEAEKEKGLICFSKTLGNHAPGNYVYVDGDYFYLTSIGDRGEIEERVKSPKVEDVLYEIYWGITARVSIEYARVNKKEGQDWRRIMFPKRLELLKLIGEQYYLKGKKEIENTLAENPYNDKLLG